jgi:hypothetical protein
VNVKDDMKELLEALKEVERAARAFCKNRHCKGCRFFEKDADCPYTLSNSAELILKREEERGKRIDKQD